MRMCVIYLIIYLFLKTNLWKWNNKKQRNNVQKMKEFPILGLWESL